MTSTVLRILFGTFYILLFLTAKELDYVILIISSLLFGGIAFITPYQWNNKTKIRYWYAMTGGIVMSLFVLIIEVILAAN